jgi:DNA invertase Pin-like site-specific DNA recombinase
MSYQTSSERQITRCAIYTRKSTEHGLDAAVSSLDTQRDVCRSYIKCQAHRKWITVPQHYDDGGYSGGTMERPALQRLIADIEAARVDMIVIYKVDRLTRSLLDFVRLIDVLERHHAGFVSVTQAFDTSDSMGRLVLNVLLTFAQFERELMSDRVRDKKAVMARNGLFTGGLPPFGYLVSKGGHLLVDAERAPLVQSIYKRYIQERSTKAVVDDLHDQGCRTRVYVSKQGLAHGGQPITTAIVRRILTNPIYTGSIVHRGEWIPAQVRPLITKALWDEAQKVRIELTSISDPARDFLLGFLFDQHGRRMGIRVFGPGRTNKLRYYHSSERHWSSAHVVPRLMVNADKLERLAISTLSALLFDRVRLNEAVLSMRLYSREIEKALRQGARAARRIADMDKPHLRSALLALISRAEVSQRKLSLYVSCPELVRFLEWDGTGHFQRKAPANSTGEPVYLLSSSAILVSPKSLLTLSIKPRVRSDGTPKPWLVSVLKQALELHSLVLENREKTIGELAKIKRMGPAHFARVLRASYLAPDIQASIMDGTQPDTLTQYDMLNSALPLDWEQQRQFLGFSAL